MMLSAGFNEHPNHDSKKRERSGTAELYNVRPASG
jgi:hypothetical protein